MDWRGLQYVIYLLVKNAIRAENDNIFDSHDPKSAARAEGKMKSH